MGAVASSRKGATFACVSAFSFALMGLASDIAVDGASATTIVAFRSIVIITLSLASGGSYTTSRPRSSLPLLVCRGLIDATGLVLWIVSLEFIPASVAMAILMMAPLFVSWITICLEKTHIDFGRNFIIIATFCGVFLIIGTRLTTDAVGIAICMISMFLYAGSLLVGRQLALSERPQTVTFFSALISAAILLPVARYQMPISVSFAIMALGILAFVGHYCLLKALASRLNVSYLFTLYYIQVPLLACFEHFWLAVSFEPLQLVGFLTCASTISFSVYQHRSDNSFADG